MPTLSEDAKKILGAALGAVAALGVSVWAYQRKGSVPKTPTLPTELLIPIFDYCPTETRSLRLASTRFQKIIDGLPHSGAYFSGKVDAGLSAENPAKALAKALAGGLGGVIIDPLSQKSLLASAKTYIGAKQVEQLTIIGEGKNGAITDPECQATFLDLTEGLVYRATPLAAIGKRGAITDLRLQNRLLSQTEDLPAEERTNVFADIGEGGAITNLPLQERFLNFTVGLTKEQRTKVLAGIGKGGAITNLQLQDQLLDLTDGLSKQQCASVLAAIGKGGAITNLDLQDKLLHLTAKREGKYRADALVGICEGRAITDLDRQRRLRDLAKGIYRDTDRIHQNRAMAALRQSMSIERLREVGVQPFDLPLYKATDPSQATDCVDEVMSVASGSRQVSVPVR